MVLIEKHAALRCACKFLQVSFDLTLCSMTFESVNKGIFGVFVLIFCSFSQILNSKIREMNISIKRINSLLEKLFSQFVLKSYGLN